MAKKEKKPKKKDILALGDILTPINLDQLGSDMDPCFGKSYDLSTDECKICGDAELCCIRTAAELKVTRKQLEAENHYKDLDSLVDKKAVFKSFRNHKRKGLDRDEIFDRVQAKYELPRNDVKTLYKKWRELDKESKSKKR